MAEDSSTPATPKVATPKAAAAKKEKPLAPEDKPFQEFIEQHFLPALTQALEAMGLAGVSLALQEAPLGVTQAGSDPYWQVRGQFPTGGRQFSVVFAQPNITGPKFFYCAEGGDRASILEQFMGDERKITLDLLVLYVLKRLNGQKWLARN